MIQQRARSVFQLANGTGSYIEYNGERLIMTNSHVVGSKNCGLTGCEVTLQFDANQHKFGKTSRKVYLTPFAESLTSDVAFFRPSDNEAFIGLTPLKFANLPAQTSLMEKKVHAIGYPALARKKWSTGGVVAKNNGWYRGTYFSMPGSSGSPVLSSEGTILGIHHRAQPKLAIMTASSFLYSGIFTPFDKITEVLDKFLSAEHQAKDHFLDVHEATTLKQAIQNRGVYIGSGVLPQLKSKRPFKVAITKRCLRSDLSETKSVKKFRQSLAACQALASWINCRGAKDTYICPKQNRPQIEDKFLAIAQQLKSFDAYEFSPYLFAVGKMYKSQKAGRRKTIGMAKNLLTVQEIEGNYKQIRSIIAMAHTKQDLKFGKLDILAELLKFSNQTNYQYQIVDIVKSLKHAHRKKLLSKKALDNALAQISKDHTSLPVGALLALDINH